MALRVAWRRSAGKHQPAASQLRAGWRATSLQAANLQRQYQGCGQLAALSAGERRSAISQRWRVSFAARHLLPAAQSLRWLSYVISVASAIWRNNRQPKTWLMVKYQ
jgi:hypothetical protein